MAAMSDSWLVGRYKVLKLLGKGGFAQTYLAVDQRQTQSYCVVKHLTPANPSPQFLETARRLFQAEVDTLRRLGSHPQIPALLDAFEVDGEFYLVQEFIDGMPLDQWFATQGPLTEAETVRGLREILLVLRFIHGQQVIHRDIKPSNLMRRAADGQLILIDFGAVKEIATELYTESSEEFTVSIGTQGYAAPEQMAGRPRYSSDLHALGMTMIRGLTGRSPTDLPENPTTGELLWDPEVSDISSGLKVFLQRLTRASLYQRYASAAAALAELEQYERLTVPPSAAIPTTAIHPPTTPTDVSRRLPWGATLAALCVTVVVLLIRQLGGWVPLELWIYDRWMQHQPQQPPDKRLLVVQITEADLMALQQTTPGDATLAQLIKTLQTHDPQVIGLDLYRDIPQGNGQMQLLEQLSADNVIAIRQLGNTPSEQIPAPRGVPPERIGFNDFPVDSDGVVRRNLLLASTDLPSDTAVLYSFSLRLALAYLKPRNILPLASDANPDYLDLNGTTYVPLRPNFGGYRRVDDGGYQIMLQYRGAQRVIPSLSLGEVLSGQFEAELIRDRIVIIGTTAASAKDFFLTPYSATAEADFLMPGVMLHAHATSQIVSTALGERSLYWAMPELIELAWILLAAAGGLMLTTRMQRLSTWCCGLGLGSIVLIGVPIGVFMIGGWMPMTSAIVAYAATAIATALLQRRSATKLTTPELSLPPLP